jgi:hypothetical protein
MIEILGLLIAGFFVGLYGTLVGIGGGPLIVPLIAMVYHYDTAPLIATSLFVIFFNTLSGSIAYFRENRVDVVAGTKFGLAAIPGALVSTFAVYQIDLDIFSFYFGLFLLALAVYIFFRPAESDAVMVIPATAGPVTTGVKTRSNPIRGSRYSSARATRDMSSAESDPFKEENLAYRIIEDTMGNIYKYKVNEPLGMAVTALIGVFSTFLGIGGGLVQVPVMVYLLSFPIHVATATTHYITAINTGFTLIPFMVNNDVAYGPAITLSVAAVAGAQVGARISNKIPGKTLLKLLIPIFLFTGIKLMFF